MRILCIRGENLASLAKFTVDFKEEPLASAGLFAITGKTGAGKSTLLDAICVALYDRTPRLTDVGGVEIVDLPGNDADGARVGANDVRTILRRGAGRGWAKVDFIGTDRGRYRATWTVWRAHDRPSGALQPQTIELERLNDAGEPSGRIGRTKTEILSAIEKQVGLSFEQFRRAALLAQGEFAAFLRARPADRADLLERMTDTGIYAEVSKQANAEARWWNDKIRELQAERDNLRAMSGDEREALDDEASTLSSERGEVQKAVSSASTALVWYKRSAELQQSLTSAQEVLRVAEANLTGSAGLARELRMAEQAGAHRQTWSNVSRLRGEARDAVLLVEAADVAVKGEQAKLVIAQGELDLAVKGVTAAETAWTDTQPQLIAARALDEQLRIARESQARAQQIREEKEAIRRTAENDHRQAVGELGKVERARDEAVQWQSANALLGQLAGGAAGWIPSLDTAVSLHKLRQALAHEQPAAEKARAGAVANEAIERAKAAAATDAEAAAENAAAAAEAELAAGQADLPALFALATTDVERCQRLVECARSQATALEERDEERKAVDQQLAIAIAERERASLLRSELPIVSARLDEARSTLRRFEATLDLAGHRAQLVDGEPCPLCGAEAHPWAQGGAPNQELEGQRARVTALDTQLRDNEAACARAEALAQQAKCNAADLAKRLETLATAIAERQQAWLQDVVGLEVSAMAEDPMACAQAAAGYSQAVRRRDDVHGRLTAREQHAEAAQRLRSEATKARNLASEAREALRTAVEAAQQAAVQLGLASERAGERTRRWTELHTALAELWSLQPAWSHLLDADPAQVLGDLHSQAAAWSQKAAELDAARSRVAELAPQCAVAEVQFQNAALVANEAAKTLTEATEAVVTLAAQRASVLNGEEADAAQARLQVAQQAAAARQQTAQAAVGNAIASLAAARAALDAASAAAARTTNQATVAQTALVAALAALGVDEAELVRRLANDDAWQLAVREQLQTLEKAVATAKGALHSCHSETENHALSAPRSSIDEATAALQSAQRRTEAIDVRSGEIGEKIRSDDGVRAEAAQVELRLLWLTDQAKPWQALNGQIGSSDGRSFRIYAQGLTLDVLVHHANCHLRGLARRYRLQRVPGSDLELQVQDSDMADEVRGLATLSGGETFLVSLALALGLASLSSRAVAIESLFIDEGFGTLDPDTLATAVSVLQGLHQSGRKVGVISHVPSLADELDAEIRVEPRGPGLSEVRVLARRDV